MGSTVEIIDIQLRKIDVENEYEDAIQDKLIAKQRERRAQIEQEIEKLEEEIDQINSLTDAKVEEIYALSEAEALKI